jgi:ATP-dependent protease HslVU (ClpYQ) peptidase subunit
MTCIVGIANPKTGAVSLGCDSQKTQGSYIQNDETSKIWSLNKYGKKWVFGEAGNLRHLQLCMFMEWPTHHDRSTNLEFLIRDFVPSLRSTLGKANRLVVKEALESTDSVLLVGVEGGLYEVDGSFGINMVSSEYWAIGSGKATAIGSLETTQGLRGWTSRRRIEKALEVASKFCTGVSAPYHYIE